MYRPTIHFVVIFSAIIVVISGCRCGPRTVDRRHSYCKAEFTIRGKVVKYGGLEVPHSSDKQHKKYLLFPIRPYRNPVPGIRSIYIFTPNHSHLCEKNLTIGITYIFNGTNQELYKQSRIFCFHQTSIDNLMRVADDIKKYGYEVTLL